MYRKLILFTTALALASLACGAGVPTPKQPGPETTDEISVKYPDADEINLQLSFGAGELTVSPGADSLLEGTATYNYDEFKPEIIVNGGNIEARVGDGDLKFTTGFKDLKNEWDLKLGGEPMNLSIDAGAYDGAYELGGLALTRLDMADGAANVEINFSEPNPVEMSTFTYNTGASDVQIFGLGNANFTLFDFASGAGDYLLDFSGELRRDASVKIETGLSNVILVVPEGVNATVRVEGGLSNVNTTSGWERSGAEYRQEGDGPALTIIVEMGMGGLTLTR